MQLLKRCALMGLVALAGLPGRAQAEFTIRNFTEGTYSLVVEEAPETVSMFLGKTEPEEGWDLVIAPTHELPIAPKAAMALRWDTQRYAEGRAIFHLLDSDETNPRHLKLHFRWKAVKDAATAVGLNLIRPQGAPGPFASVTHVGAGEVTGQELWITKASYRDLPEASPDLDYVKTFFCDHDGSALAYRMEQLALAELNAAAEAAAKGKGPERKEAKARKGDAVELGVGLGGQATGAKPAAAAPVQASSVSLPTGPAPSQPATIHGATAPAAAGGQARPASARSGQAQPMDLQDDSDRSRQTARRRPGKSKGRGGRGKGAGGW